MWKELAMVQFHIKLLAEEKEESKSSLSENSACPIEELKKFLLKNSFYSIEEYMNRDATYGTGVLQ